ncbi:MAG: SIS domain-containing protein [bacterium]
MVDLIASSAHESIHALETSVKRLAPDIADAASMIAASIGKGGRILACGNGGSAADAQHLAGELVGRFLMDREPYSAIALSSDTSVITSLANDFGYECVFERQVLAHGRKGDVLVAISTSGNSPNVLCALEAAKKINMKIIGLTGKGGGKMLGLVDVLLDADSTLTPRIQETHGFIIHALCDLTEWLLNEPD